MRARLLGLFKGRVKDGCESRCVQAEEVEAEREG